MTGRLGVAIMLFPSCRVVKRCRVAGEAALLLSNSRAQLGEITRPEVAAEFENFEDSYFWPLGKA